MKACNNSLSLVLLAAAALSANPSLAQNGSIKPTTPIAASAPTAVPSLIPYSGVAIAADGKLLSGETGITFQIYKQQSGGEALWTESHIVSVDETGHYQIQLGATYPNGLPADLFSTGEARWLDVLVAGEAPRPRILLASVPYALKASDAETLGGFPASAFVLAGSKIAANLASAGAPNASPDVTSSTVTTPGGTDGYLPVFTGSATIADSILFENASGIGIGDIPNSTLDVNGKSTFRGAILIARAGNATTTAGANSNPISLVTQAYDSTLKANIAPWFTLEAEASSNNTAAAGATLNLLYENGIAANPSETGFHFNPNSLIHFATGQTFPGTGTGNGTITGVTAGTGLTGGGTSGQVTLNLNTATTNGLYAQLAGNNTFTASQTYNAGTTFQYAPLFNGGLSAYAPVSIATTYTGLSVHTTQSGSIYASLAVPTSDSPSGNAIEGVAQNAYSGVYGYGDDKSEAGVVGYGNIGVYATSDLSGIPAHSAEAATLTAAVYAQAGTISSEGKNFSFLPASVFADGGAASASRGSQIAVLGVTDNNDAAYFLNNGDSTALYAENDGTGLLFEAYSGYSEASCVIDYQADLTCSGTISGSNLTADKRNITTYGVQAAENWYEDAGSGQLQNGVARVALDATFGETVNTTVEYHVFLTPKGDCKGLYVANETPDGFEVHELSGGHSGVAFDYRIMAKRKGYEQVRLADITDQVRQRQVQQEKLHPVGAAAKQARLPIVPPKPVAVSHPQTASLNPIGQHEVR